MSRSLNVLVFAKAFPPNLGGVETYSEQVAAAYARWGANVTVVTQFNGDLSENERVVRGGRVRVVNVGAGQQLAVFLRMLKIGWAEWRRAKPDLIHATTWRVSLPALLLSAVCGRCPLVLTVHGREVLQTDGVLTSAMHFAASKASRILVISQSAKSACLSALPCLAEKGFASWNGITWPDAAPKKSYAIDPGRPMRLFVACQLTQRKNVAAAVRAIHLLEQRYGVTAELTIAGDGPERDNIARLSQELGCDHQVHLLGMVQRDALPALYTAADVFLHPHSQSHDPTDMETFCLAVADAMALGLPVIVGRDGAPSEYITEGSNGYLVDGNDAAQLADRLFAVYAMSKSERQAVGTRAHEFAVTSFNWDRHIRPALALVGSQ